MIKMIPAKLDLSTAKIDLAALDKLLADNEELEETGSVSLQEFFTLRPKLLLLTSRAFCPGLLPAHTFTGVRSCMSFARTMPWQTRIVQIPIR